MRAIEMLHRQLILINDQGTTPGNTVVLNGITFNDNLAVSPVRIISVNTA